MNMYDMCLLHARSDRALRSYIASHLHDSKITMMEWLLLGVINEGGVKGSSMSEIAGALHVTLPQVTALVNKLLPLKLVKQKSATTDRRSRLVSLTQKGQLTLQESNKVLEDARAELFKGVDEATLGSYSDVLGMLSSKNL